MTARLVAVALLQFPIPVLMWFLGRRHGWLFPKAPPSEELLDLRAELLLLRAENRAALTPQGRDQVLLQRERERLAEQCELSAKASSGVVVRVFRTTASWLRAGAPQVVAGSKVRP